MTTRSSRILSKLKSVDINDPLIRKTIDMTFDAIKNNLNKPTTTCKYLNRDLCSKGCTSSSIHTIYKLNICPFNGTPSQTKEEFCLCYK